MDIDPCAEMEYCETCGLYCTMDCLLWKSQKQEVEERHHESDSA